MSIQLKEYPDSRSATSNPQTRTLHFWMSGIQDDDAARIYVTDNTPPLFDGYYRQNIDLKPNGAGFWVLDVHYGALPDKQGSADFPNGRVSFSFDTTGGTAHITQSKETISSHVLAGVAPDHKGAIGVTDNGPEGVDVIISQFSWTEDWMLPIAYASFSGAVIVKAVTGRINSTAFRGFGAGQVRFDGAVIAPSSKNWEYATGSYRFTQSDDTADAMPLFKAGIAKAGWEYIWAESEKEEDDVAKRIVQPPVAAFVERVYDTANFGVWGIGTGLI